MSITLRPGLLAPGASPSAHTPGPWNAKVDELVPERGAVYIEGPQGWDTQAICDCRFSDEGIEVDEANARLIAAAPDMLAALKLQHKCMTGADSPNDIQLREAAKAIAAAIARAEGR